MAHPTVVEDAGARACDGQAAIAATERLGVPHRANADPVAHEADLGGVPPLSALYVLVVTEEMQVVEEHAFHASVLEQLGAARPNRQMVVLVEDLVRL